jgi:hypothetical protein
MSFFLDPKWRECGGLIVEPVRSPPSRKDGARERA